MRTSKPQETSADNVTALTEEVRRLREHDRHRDYFLGTVVLLGLLIALKKRGPAQTASLSTPSETASEIAKALALAYGVGITGYKVAGIVGVNALLSRVLLPLFVRRKKALPSST